MSQNFVVLSLSLRIVFLTAKAQRKCKRIIKVVVDVSKLRSSVFVSADSFFTVNAQRKCKRIIKVELLMSQNFVVLSASLRLIFYRAM